VYVPFGVPWDSEAKWRHSMFGLFSTGLGMLKLVEYRFWEYGFAGVRISGGQKRSSRHVDARL